jgi:hypothetical protein
MPPSIAKNLLDSFRRSAGKGVSRSRSHGGLLVSSRDPGDLPAFIRVCLRHLKTIADR